MPKVLDFIMAEPWAITPEGLEQIIAIASRQGEDLEALAARLGRPLENTYQAEQRGDAAIIPVHGPIFRYANLFTQISGATSLEIAARDFTAALDNPAVSRIVLDIDSPGGQTNGVSEFAAMVRAADKPVTAYVGGTGASAAYWIAAGADQIVASDTAMLGSIGVVATLRPNQDGAIRIISSQSPLKQADPETEEGRTELQRVVDDMAAVFIETVATYRGVTPETVAQQFGRGGVLIGAKAVAVGMADRVGDFESLLAGLTGSTMRSIAMSGKTTATSPEITRDLIAAEHPAIADALRAEGRDALASNTEALLALPAVVEAISASYEKGGADENARIQAVEAQGKKLPGFESLVDTMKFDRKTTGPEAAVSLLEANGKRTEKAAADRKEETPDPLPPAGDLAGLAGAESNESFEAKVAAYEEEGMSHAKAMRTAVDKHPELHKQWLARLDNQKAS